MKIEIDPYGEENWNDIQDGLKLGIQKYGWNSEFRKEYESLCFQLRFEYVTELFKKWKVFSV